MTEEQTTTSENTKKIAALREEIDAVDARIVKMLAERASLAKAVGVAKGAGAVVYRPERERAILDRVAALNEKERSHLPESVIRTLYRDIIASCRAVEEPPTVAYLGPQGTFTEMAVIEQFGHAFRGMPCTSIDDVFGFAESGNAAFAVVPVENSTEGTVTRTVDRLLTTSLVVISEVNVDVRHNLMSRTGDITKIREVHAHPQALGQCRAWLCSHVGSARQVAASSNAAAAVLAKENPAVAAVASRRAAELYDLKIVAAGIQDDPRNRTRFLVLGKKMPDFVPGVRFKTSVVFSVPNVAGSLMKALEPLRAHGVSMTRLESRPARNGAWDYNFYADFEGAMTENHVAAALEEIRSLSSFFKVLGTYPECL